MGRPSLERFAQVRVSALTPEGETLPRRLEGSLPIATSWRAELGRNGDFPQNGAFQD